MTKRLHNRRLFESKEVRVWRLSTEWSARNIDRQTIRTVLFNHVSDNLVKKKQ